MDPVDRAELSEEIALQLWRAFPSFDPSRQISTWLYRITLNVAISHVRQQSERRALTLGLDIGLHDAPDPTNQEPELEQEADGNDSALKIQSRLATARRYYIITGMCLGLPSGFYGYPACW